MHTKDRQSNAKHEDNDGAKNAHQEISSSQNGHNTQAWVLSFEFSQLDLVIRSSNKCTECQCNSCETQHHLNWMQNATTFMQQLNIIKNLPMQTASMENVFDRTKRYAVQCSVTRLR